LIFDDFVAPGEIERERESTKEQDVVPSTVVHLMNLHVNPEGQDWNVRSKFDELQAELSLFFTLTV
jgi:hypothetical protein